MAAAVVAWSVSGCASHAPPASSAPQTPPNQVSIPTSRAVARPGFPIIQGLTNATSTQIAIVAPRADKLRFFLGEIESPSSSPKPRTLAAQTISSDGSATVVHHLVIDRLRSGIVYRLEIRDETEKILDHREFRTLDTSSRPARVIAASCLYDAYLKESVAMWKAVADAKPDLMLLVGDNVYAQINDGRFPSPLNEQALWTRYVETFQVLDFYRAPRLIPTLVTWDDHDYGMKDGDRTNPHQAAAKKVLTAFFPQTPQQTIPEFSAGPGVSSKFDAFGYRFLLLDDRSFRTPKGMRPQSHFGDEQERWIFNNVASSQHPVWLISGDQWFGGYHRFESFEGSHPEAFKSFVASLKNSRRPVMLISGDRHLSEVMKIEKEKFGYETYEFTSSSLHSRPHPSNWATVPNPRQLMGVDMKHTFTQFDLKPTIGRKPVVIRGAAIGAESKVFYAFELTVKAQP